VCAGYSAADDVNSLSVTGLRTEHPSDTSSLTSSAVTSSLAGATSSLVGNSSALSSALTDETNLSWIGSAQLDKVLRVSLSLPSRYRMVKIGLSHQVFA